MASQPGETALLKVTEIDIQVGGREKILESCGLVARRRAAAVGSRALRDLSWSSPFWLLALGGRLSLWCRRARTRPDGWRKRLDGISARYSDIGGVSIAWISTTERWLTCEPAIHSVWRPVPAALRGQCLRRDASYGPPELAVRSAVLLLCRGRSSSHWR